MTGTIRDASQRPAALTGDGVLRRKSYHRASRERGGEIGERCPRPRGIVNFYAIRACIYQRPALDGKKRLINDPWNGNVTLIC